MKKKILVLGLIASILCMMFGMTAMAGANMADEDVLAAQYSESISETIESFIGMIGTGEADLIAAQSPDMAEMIDTLKTALSDMGEFTGIKDYSGTMDGDLLTVTVNLLGSQKNATAVLSFNFKTGEQNFTCEVDKTFGELMTNAGLNTLLGMGTVFAVLILISIVITCFEFIPKIQAAFTKKEAAAPAAAVEQAVAQIEAQEEDLADDLELVAVISAAIAAAEGTSADGFVVRSIRRATAVRGARF